MSKSVSFYCAQTAEPFNPESIAKEGRGGSEEALWHISRRLAKLGWQVEVFADTGEDSAREFAGVLWRPFWEFDIKEPREVLVIWRRTFPFQSRAIKAKKTYFWVHDALLPAESPLHLTEEMLGRISKLLVLSKWHQSLYPNIPDNKFSIKNNGIDLEEIKKVKIKRNPCRLIYTSAYYRGLETLVNLFAEIKQQVPRAELHVFYGWFFWDAIYGKDPLMQQRKEEIKKTMVRLGIQEHGRVSQEQILQEYAKSSILAYPTEFGEVSFISGMKAQALGCIPVTTTAGCLEETIKFGLKVKSKKIYSDTDAQKKWVQGAVNLLKNPPSEKQREKMMSWARKRFDWDRIAEEWHEELL